MGFINEPVIFYACYFFAGKAEEWKPCCDYNDFAGPSSALVPFIKQLDFFVT